MCPTERADPRTVLVRVRAALPGLRPSERRIAEAILDDPHATAGLTVAELAAACDTSTTTVVRFYQRIGYGRYKDLRLDLTREATREQLETANLPAASGDIDRDDTIDDIIAKVAANETLSIADTAEILDRDALARAVDCVLNARRVDSFGVGASGFVGLDLQQKLTRIGRTALSWLDTDAAWSAAVTLDEQCVAIAISHTGTTAATVEFLAMAAAEGATTIAITNHDNTALAETADVVLTTAARETRFRSGALGSRIAQLMVVDCLFTGVARASYDASMSALRKTYAAVHRKGRGQRLYRRIVIRRRRPGSHWVRAYPRWRATDRTHRARGPPQRGEPTRNA
ncbi:MurR/RpiR family transcriptional regulator [Stackebrandtia nassauensis]|uniref:Transcriptional regulator, RpiR family n=1 Tax=Stackebrandtia nassauensis (strain DSM 44728 / CIP 108903 / NRRL B-16338 / NBRC 102104 / LLR-40K-21) TaxID=446470 RepID=D3PVQ6_STANL|nr:MurR/RpiR family transcriptional regulator [Stackebrandtia nassauensis]ADD43170.1 transcriptional regulator, RpiR family [Stackebrandtia nassauensis DSM 44728]